MLTSGGRDFAASGAAKTTAVSSPITVLSGPVPCAPPPSLHFGSEQNPVCGSTSVAPNSAIVHCATAAGDVARPAATSTLTCVTTPVGTAVPFLSSPVCLSVKSVTPNGTRPPACRYPCASDSARLGSTVSEVGSPKTSVKPVAFSPQCSAVAWQLIPTNFSTSTAPSATAGAETAMITPVIRARNEKRTRDLIPTSLVKSRHHRLLGPSRPRKVANFNRRIGRIGQISCYLKCHSGSPRSSGGRGDRPEAEACPVDTYFARFTALRR